MTIVSSFFGRRSEDFAKKKLQKLGYTILDQNYRTPFGEIDIIAKDKDTLVFIEVKARKTVKQGYPIEAVNWLKLKKIQNSALAYMALHNSTSKVRLEVFSILILNGKVSYKITKVT